MVVVSFEFHSSPSKRLVTILYPVYSPPLPSSPPPRPAEKKTQQNSIPFHCSSLSNEHLSTIFSSDIYNLARYLGQASPPRGVA